LPGPSREFIVRLQYNLNFKKQSNWFYTNHIVLIY
jgi:hypothetical protein